LCDCSIPLEVIVLDMLQSHKLSPHIFSLEVIVLDMLQSRRQNMRGVYVTAAYQELSPSESKYEGRVWDCSIPRTITSRDKI
jgi:hypothetical protein